MPELEEDDWWRHGRKSEDDDEHESAEWDEGEDDSIVRCPHCDAELVDDDVVQCPDCGRYLSREEYHAPHNPSWVIWTGVICFIAILFGSIFYLFGK